MATNSRGVGIILSGLVVVAFAAGLGCASTKTAWHPRSAIQLPQVAEQAVVIYEDDIQAVDSAGGKVIGTIDGAQNEWGATYASHEEIARYVSLEAAKHGGTHVIIASEGSDQVTHSVAGHSQTTMSVTGNTLTSNTTYTPPAQYTVAHNRGTYVIVRVPEENWSSLPEGLRPMKGCPMEWWERPHDGTCPVRKVDDTSRVTSAPAQSK